MASDGKIGWGVIGACGIAKRRTIPEGIMKAANARLVAITDVNEAGAQELAGQLQVKACKDVKALLRTPGVEAVYVATPNDLHKAHVIAAAKKGKHVLCEKQLANSARDIRRMIAVCKEKNVLFGVGFMMRFNVYHQKLRAMLCEGKIGTPVMARGQMTCWYPPIPGAWRQTLKTGGGGPLDPPDDRRSPGPAGAHRHHLARTGAAGAKKNRLKPWLKEQCGLPARTVHSYIRTANHRGTHA